MNNNSINNEKKSRSKKGDIILICSIVAVLVITCVVLSIVMFGKRKHKGELGEKVVVYMGDAVIFEQELSQDCELPITGANGYNKLVIKAGIAYIEEADCPEQVCVQHDPVSYKGELIVCLPHELIVEVK